MSFIMFQQRCEDCRREWNAAFGVTGTTFTALPCEQCPYCKGHNISRIAEGWKKTYQYGSGTGRNPGYIVGTD